MLLYHCYHFKYIELNMISLKSVVELLLLNMWQTSSGIKEDNFDFVSKFDMLKRWSPSSLFTTPNGKRGVTRTCFKCLENIILREWNMSSLAHYWYEMTTSPILCLPSCLRGGGLGSKFYFSIIWVDLNFRNLPSGTFYRIKIALFIADI